MFANQTTTLNTTAGLLTQTRCFPQLVIESPHCLIGNRTTPQPDLKHLLKLVGTSALPFRNKNYIINWVKWRLVFWWLSGNERTPGPSEQRAIRAAFALQCLYMASLLTEASRLTLALFLPCRNLMFACFLAFRIFFLFNTFACFDPEMYSDSHRANNSWVIFKSQVLIYSCQLSGAE